MMSADDEYDDDSDDDHHHSARERCRSHDAVATRTSSTVWLDVMGLDKSLMSG